MKEYVIVSMRVVDGKFQRKERKVLWDDDFEVRLSDPERELLRKMDEEDVKAGDSGAV